MSDSRKIDNCDSISPLLDAYHDNEVTDEERQLVESHLEKCQACNRSLAASMQIASALQSLPRETLSRDLAVDVEALLGQPPETDKQQGRVIPFKKRGYAILAAAACLAALCVAAPRLLEQDKPVIAERPEKQSAVVANKVPESQPDLPVNQHQQDNSAGQDVTVAPNTKLASRSGDQEPVEKPKASKPDAPVRVAVAPKSGQTKAAPAAEVAGPDELLSTEAVVAYGSDGSDDQFNLFEDSISTSEDGLYAIKL